MSKDIDHDIKVINQSDLLNFLRLGQILIGAEKFGIWDKADLTKKQWLASQEVPAIVAKQATEAASLMIKDFETNGLTVGKLKLILPLLKKETDLEKRKAIMLNACTMFHNDLRDLIGEKNTKEECEPDQWIRKEYWYCPLNGRRVYTDPAIQKL